MVSAADARAAAAAAGGCHEGMRKVGACRREGEQSGEGAWVVCGLAYERGRWRRVWAP